MKRFLNWLTGRKSPKKASHNSSRSRPSAVPGPTARPVRTSRPAQRTATNSDYVEFDATVDGKIDDNGPGKNVLRRTKFVREEAGTHDTLAIVDDSAAVEDNSDAEGIDPYNTGKFDRSKNWDKRFRKD